MGWNQDLKNAHFYFRQSCMDDAVANQLLITTTISKQVAAACHFTGLLHVTGTSSSDSNREVTVLITQRPGICFSRSCISYLPKQLALKRNTVAVHVHSVQASNNYGGIYPSTPNLTVCYQQCVSAQCVLTLTSGAIHAYVPMAVVCLTVCSSLRAEPRSQI